MSPNDLSDEELYVVVRRAVRDAIWDVVDTVVTIGLAILAVLVGLGFAAQGLRATAGFQGFVTVAFGVVLVGVAALFLLRELGFVEF